jgi:hypothetical protein
MSYSNILKPTLITGQQYGTKVSVEIDHSDTDITELFDAFQTICIGLGYDESSWKQCVVDKAEEYKEEADEEAMYEPNAELRRAAEEYVRLMSEQQIDEALAEHNEDEWNDELETQFWNEQPSEPFATPEEVEKYNIDGEFDEYGKRNSKVDKKKNKKNKK